MRSVFRRPQWTLGGQARDRWLMVAGLALLALFLLPARLAALRGDDAWSIEQRGELELHGSSLPAELRRSLQTAIDSGRPQLLGGQGDLVTWLFDGHPTAYRLFLIALTVWAGALLFQLARRFGASATEALGLLVILAGAIQFRAFHDAMLGYYGTVQIVLVLTLASLLWFVRGLRDGSRRAFLISFLLFLPCPMLYEIAYPLVGLHLAAALVERKGLVAALRPSAPFLLLAVLFTAASYLGRAGATAVLDSYSVSTSPTAILRSYGTQLFPPLPASNMLLGGSEYNGQPLGADPTTAELLAGAWRGAAVFAVLLFVFLRSAPASGRPSAARPGAMAAVGGMLWLTPPLLLAAAPKYQESLTLGRGYLPVLMQVFGWALVATAGCVALMRLTASRGPAVRVITAGGLAGLLGLAAGVVGFNNARVIALETPVRETRLLTEDAVDAGLLSEVPERSSLLFANRDLNWPLGNWTLSNDPLESMIVRLTDRRFDARIMGPNDPFDCTAGGSFPPPDCSPLSRRRGWVQVRGQRGAGTVIVARAVPGRGRPATMPEAAQEPASWVRVFVEARDGQPAPPLLTGRTASRQMWTSEGQRWQQRGRGHGWAIYALSVDPQTAPTAASLDDPRSLIDFNRSKPPGQIVRIYGTRRLLP